MKRKIMYNKGASHIKETNKKGNGKPFSKAIFSILGRMLRMKFFIPFIVGISLIYSYGQIIKKSPAKITGTIQYKGDIDIIFDKSQSETISPMVGLRGEQNKENYKGISLFAKQIELKNTILHDSTTRRLAGHDSTSVSGYLITSPRAQGNTNWRPEVYFRASLYEIVKDKKKDDNSKPKYYRYDFYDEPYFEIITNNGVLIELTDSISIINYIPCDSTSVSIHQEFDINTSRISEATINQKYDWDIGCMQWEEYKDEKTDSIKYFKNSPHRTPDYPTIDLASKSFIFHFKNGVCLRTEKETFNISDREYFLVVETYFPARVTVFGITSDDIKNVDGFKNKSGYNYPSMGQLYRKKGFFEAKIHEFIEDNQFENIKKNYSIEKYQFPNGIKIRQRHIERLTMICYDTDFLKSIGWYKMTFEKRDSLSEELIRKKGIDTDTTKKWGLGTKHGNKFKMTMLFPVSTYMSYEEAISYNTYNEYEIQSNPPILPNSNSIGIFGKIKSLEFQKVKGNISCGKENFPISIESTIRLFDLKKFDYDDNSISISGFLPKRNELDFRGIGYAEINGNNVSLNKFNSNIYKYIFYCSSFLILMLSGFGFFDVKLPSPIKKRNMRIIKIFLASSIELSNDRREFEIFIGRQNKHLKNNSIFLELQIWEDFPDFVSKTRLQDEYNKAISESDIFVSLFFTKAGKYTNEEFEHALDCFKENNKPLILTYFKNEFIKMESIKLSDFSSLRDFQGRLTELGHFYTTYDNVDSLKHHFSQQLTKLGIR